MGTAFKKTPDGTLYPRITIVIGSRPAASRINFVKLQFYVASRRLVNELIMKTHTGGQARNGNS